MAGYLYQVRLGLLWAIRRSRTSDFTVSIETLDDVSFEVGGQPDTVLQTKHSLNATANLPDVSGQQVRLDELREQEAQLNEVVSTETIQARLESCLSNVNRHLSDYAKQIDLEYSDSPLRLDPRNLTIVADTPERGVSMREIGSGENHVGYHIVAHLALHTWFASRGRPVPSFLLLDQLSQAHFSPDTLPGNGVTQEKIDADRQAVKRLFNLIFDVVEKLGGKFQVLITDHPDFSDDVRFQAALRERWRDGLKLVPEDWPRSV